MLVLSMFSPSSSGRPMMMIRPRALGRRMGIALRGVFVCRASSLRRSTLDPVVLTSEKHSFRSFFESDRDHRTKKTGRQRGNANDRRTTGRQAEHTNRKTGRRPAGGQDTRSGATMHTLKSPIVRRLHLPFTFSGRPIHMNK